MKRDAVTTIQVHKPTVDRLSALKLPGLTYEDVINFALDKLPPAELEALYRAWQKDAMAKLAGAGRPLQRGKS
jgi:hypothetical protein